ncbi:hypothetical protein OEZ86_012772 [Tetradesmus obliquus]|nr:hypothetical protein OEZ86_012772 [Tetradesmus obliquus]
MLDMDDAPCAVDGPIRSRFRGLSWDKKHQGWRVRIYYSGKQRHVGRYEDDISAAKAYDKAAVYLYGANAITNFGLYQVAEDPTEVSAFIVLAKEQADQEQAVRGQQQRLHACTADSHLVKAAQQLLPGSPLMPSNLLQQQQAHCYAGVPQMMYQQAQLPHTDMAHLAWQQQQQQPYGASSSIHCRTQALQQQLAASPTFSNSRSGSRSFAAGDRVMY